MTQQKTKEEQVQEFHVLIMKCFEGVEGLTFRREKFSLVVENRKLLTAFRNAGNHTIEVKFYIGRGSAIVLIGEQYIPRKNLSKQGFLKDYLYNAYYKWITGQLKILK